MSKLILITGGSRSGKSGYALKLAEASPGRRLFIATCPMTDDEMRERIRRHRRARSRRDWRTVEETIDLSGALNKAAGYDVCLVDCLTLWINNLMHQAEQEHEELTEEIVAGRCRELIAACRKLSGTVIFVTNEVGMGIVPENFAARRFRDLAGRCNQAMAAAADEVIFIACGLPLHLKREET